MNVLKTIYNLILVALGVWHPELHLNYEEPIADPELDSANYKEIGGTWHLW